MAAFLTIMVTSLMLANTPIRIALLDFENGSSEQCDKDTTGGITSTTLANRGVYILANLIANENDFSVIDRREFLAQIDAAGKVSGKKPSFLRAAQSLNADYVLRGVLMSFSSGKEIVNPSGDRKTEFLTFKTRIALQALDTKDGTIIATAEGSALKELRQSDAQKTVLGDDDLVDLMGKAIQNAIPTLKERIKARVEQAKNRNMVKLTIKTDADPAQVEIDGILVGTTPLVDFQVYAGDHTITVGKAGYRDISKTISIQNDQTMTFSLFRTQLSAEELKQILDKARINVVAGNVEPAIIIDSVEKEK